MQHEEGDSGSESPGEDSAFVTKTKTPTLPKRSQETGDSASENESDSYRNYTELLPNYGLGKTRNSQETEGSASEDGNYAELLPYYNRKNQSEHRESKPNSTHQMPNIRQEFDSYESSEPEDLKGKYTKLLPNSNVKITKKSTTTERLQQMNESTHQTTRTPSEKSDKDNFTDPESVTYFQITPKSELKRRAPIALSVSSEADAEEESDRRNSGNFQVMAKYKTVRQTQRIFSQTSDTDSEEEQCLSIHSSDYLVCEVASEPFFQSKQTGSKTRQSGESDNPSNEECGSGIYSDDYLLSEFEKAFGKSRKQVLDSCESDSEEESTQGIRSSDYITSITKKSTAKTVARNQSLDSCEPDAEEESELEINIPDYVEPIKIEPKKYHNARQPYSSASDLEGELKSKSEAEVQSLGAKEQDIGGDLTNSEEVGIRDSDYCEPTTQPKPTSNAKGRIKQNSESDSEEETQVGIWDSDYCETTTQPKPTSKPKGKIKQDSESDSEKETQLGILDSDYCEPTKLTSTSKGKTKQHSESDSELGIWDSDYFEPTAQPKSTPKSKGKTKQNSESDSEEETVGIWNSDYFEPTKPTFTSKGKTKQNSESDSEEEMVGSWNSDYFEPTIRTNRDSGPENGVAWGGDCFQSKRKAESNQNYFSLSSETDPTTPKPKPTPKSKGNTKQNSESDSEEESGNSQRDGNKSKSKNWPKSSGSDTDFEYEIPSNAVPSSLAIRELIISVAEGTSTFSPFFRSSCSEVYKCDGVVVKKQYISGNVKWDLCVQKIVESRKFNCKYVLCVLDYYIKDHEFYVAVPLMDGNLRTYVVDNKQLLKQNKDKNALQNWEKESTLYERVKLGLGIAQGMNELHRNNVVHGNLKLENVFYKMNNKLGTVDVKVGDFGSYPFAQYIGPLSPQLMWVPPLAPEILDGEPFSFASDVYSFGLCLWQLCTGENLFADICKVDECGYYTKKSLIALSGKMRLEMPKWIPEKLKKVIKKCTKIDPNARPCFNGEICGLLYKALLQIAIKDVQGTKFWKQRNTMKKGKFVYATRMRWDEFIDGLSSWQQWFPSNHPDFDKAEQYLKLLVTNTPNPPSKPIVSMRRFGFLLAFFGPLGDEQCVGGSGQGRHVKFVDRVVELCSQKWFHGELSENFMKWMRLEEFGSFLVRFSRTPGCFTFTGVCMGSSPSSSKVFHMRVELEDGESYVEAVRRICSQQHHSLPPGGPFQFHPSKKKSIFCF